MLKFLRLLLEDLSVLFSSNTTSGESHDSEFFDVRSSTSASNNLTPDYVNDPSYSFMLGNIYHDMFKSD